jgi:hypothetical protein
MSCTSLHLHVYRRNLAFLRKTSNERLECNTVDKCQFVARYNFGHSGIVHERERICLAPRNSLSIRTTCSDSVHASWHVGQRAFNTHSSSRFAVQILFIPAVKPTSLVSNSYHPTPTTTSARFRAQPSSLRALGTRHLGA